MPYIEEDQREELSHLVDSINETPILSTGELNYLITHLCLRYINDDKRYEYFNDVIGALECAKLEFTRRLISPYEDVKVKENGDVY